MADLGALSNEELQALYSGPRPLAKWSDDELARVFSGKEPLTAGERGADIGKSAAAGVGLAAAGLGGLPGDVQAIAEAGAGRLAGKPTTVTGGMGSLPTSKDVRGKIEEVTGPFHEPQTPEGTFARTVGEQAPSLAMPGAPVRRVMNVLAPAVGAEAGEALTGSPYGRIAGALMAGGASTRGVTPFPADPTRMKMVDILNKEGVTSTTAGQKTGREGLRYTESALGKLPFAGGKLASMEQEAGEQFTRAALRRIGEDAPRATPEVIDGAFKRIGKQFDNVASRNTALVDRQFANDVAAVQKEYDFVANPLQKSVMQSAVDDVLKVIQQNNGIIPGAQYQAMRSRIGDAARATKMSDGELSSAFYGLQRALDDTMERSIAATGNKADIAAWKEARNQYQNILVIERAITGAGENTALGLISPPQLARAATAQNRRGYARGQGDFSELAHAGEAILKPMPQSGTAPRAYAQSIPAILGAGMGAALTGGPGGAAGGAAAGGILSAAAPPLTGRAIMSKPIQNYLANQRTPVPPEELRRQMIADILLSSTEARQ